MDRGRMAWLVAVPLMAAAVAMLLGAASAATAAVVLTPFDGGDVTIGDSGRALLQLTLADLEDPKSLAAVGIGLVLTELTWAVGLGVGAQTLFPRRRRLIPALSAVLLAGVCGWVALGALAAGAEARDITVGSAARALVLASVVAGLAVFVFAGHHWPLARQPAQPRQRPAAAARPAGLH